RALGPVSVNGTRRAIAVRVVATREIRDDRPQLAVVAGDLPDVLRVLGDVDPAVLGAIADLVHHEPELAYADVLEVLARLVEDFDVRARHRVLDPLASGLVLEGAEQVAGDRDPDVTLAVDGGGARGVQARDEGFSLVASGYAELAGVRLHRLTRHPAAGSRDALVLGQRRGH